MTSSPTSDPTESPTSEPTDIPTETPTDAPSETPTTPAPTHPETILNCDGGTLSAVYNDDDLTIQVEIPFDGTFTINASSSDCDDIGLELDGTSVDDDEIEDLSLTAG